MDMSSCNVRTTNDTTTGNKGARKFWTRAEEEALISVVKDLIVEGWQAGNGWRPGFNNQVAHRIRAMIPSSDVVGNPHVISKMSAWRKDFGALSKLFSRSGQNEVGLHPTNFTITVVGTPIWEATVRTNPELEKMKLKSFPYYEDWDLIFGNSKGTGDHAVDFGSARRRAQNRPINLPPTPSVQTPGGLEDLIGETGETSPAAAVSEGSGPWKASGIKKRKVRSSGVEDEMIISLTSALDETKTAIGELSIAIRSLKEADPKVNLIFSALKELPDFTMTARVRAAKKIVTSQSHVALFLSMENDERVEFVMSILAE